MLQHITQPITVVQEMSLVSHTHTQSQTHAHTHNLK